MRRAMTSAVLLALAFHMPAAQQPANPFIARAPAPTTSSRRSKLRLAEQMRRRPDLLTGETLSDVASRFAIGKRTLGETVLMSSDEKTFYLFVHRTESSRPEVHARWDDLVIVKAGSGAIEMGDSLVGSAFRAPGERIGGKFYRSYRIVVHPGDIVRIPAVVPHAFIVSGREPLDYLVVKQRRDGLPIRWG